MIQEVHNVGLNLIESLRLAAGGCVFLELNRFPALHFGRHFSLWNDGFNLSNHKVCSFALRGHQCPERMKK